MQLLQLVYVSSATRLLDPPELFELQAAARERNRRAGISGVLLYRDGNFLQALEGPEEAVHDLERRLARDPRHHGMLVLLRRRIAEREFGADALALETAARGPRPGVPPEPAAPLPGSTPGSPAQRLLRTFHDVLR